MPERARFSPVRCFALALLAAFMGVATRSDGQIFSQDPTVTSINGDTVHESMIAVGPQWVINVGTHQVGFHNKQAWSVPSVIYTVGQFFAGNVSCDPVAYYDHINNRYLVATLGCPGPCGPGFPTTNVYLMVSNGGDPTLLTSWYKYTLTDANTADYIGLGVSDDKIVVGWQRPGSGTYVYEVLDRAAAYSGTLVRRSSPITTSDAFYKPARNTTSGADIYLVAVTSSSLLYRRITGSATTSQLESSSTTVLTPTNLLGSANGPQREAPPGTCKPLEINISSGQIADVYKRGNNIAVAWQVSKNYQDGSPPVSAVRTVRFSPGAPAVVHDDFTVGTPGVSYSFPSVEEDLNGTMFVGYDRLSANEYPSSYMIARRGAAQPSDLVHQSPELLVQAGTAAFSSCKGHPQICGANSWGDYTSVAVDEFATTGTRTVARFAGGWADGTQGPTTWPSTAIGTLNADYGLAAISGRILAYSAGVETPRPGARLELSRVAGGAGAAVALSDANGNVTFSSLPNGTYRLRTSWGAAVARVARAGTGGSGQTVISASEIEIIVSGSQVSSGNELVINAQPTPQISIISPATVNSRDPAFTLDVQGQQFSAHSIVRFNGRDKPTTFISAQLLRAQITHDDIAKPAWLASDVYKGRSSRPAPATRARQTLPTSSRSRASWSLLPSPRRGSSRVPQETANI